MRWSNSGLRLTMMILSAPRWSNSRPTGPWVATSCLWQRSPKKMRHDARRPPRVRLAEAARNLWGSPWITALQQLQQLLQRKTLLHPIAIVELCPGGPSSSVKSHPTVLLEKIPIDSLSGILWMSRLANKGPTFVAFQTSTENTGAPWCPFLKGPCTS